MLKKVSGVFLAAIVAASILGCGVTEAVLDPVHSTPTFEVAYNYATYQLSGEYLDNKGAAQLVLLHSWEKIGSESKPTCPQSLGGLTFARRCSEAQYVGPSESPESGVISITPIK